MTDAEIDATCVAEMERRDREAACPAGYRDAAWEACGDALFVPVGQGGDLLCPQCLREATALGSDDGGDDPRPPASGAMHPDYAEFAAAVARMLDDELCAAIVVADDELARLHLDQGQQEAVRGGDVGRGGAAAGPPGRRVMRSTEAGGGASRPPPLPVGMP